MTYLRADQEISQLSLETSKAAECYQYPLVKTQLGCIGCFGGTSHRRQQEGEMQPPEGHLRRRGTLTPSSPGTAAAGPNGGDGEPARAFLCPGPHPAHGPDGLSGCPASPSCPLRRWDVVAVATGGKKKPQKNNKKKKGNNNNKRVFPSGGAQHQSFGHGCGCQRWAPSLCHRPGKEQWGTQSHAGVWRPGRTTEEGPCGQPELVPR